MSKPLAGGKSTGDSRFRGARYVTPCSEHSDAKQPGHSAFRAVRSHRTHILGLPRIKVRLLEAQRVLHFHFLKSVRHSCDKIPLTFHIIMQELIVYIDYYNRRIKARLKDLPSAVHRQQALSAA